LHPMSHISKGDQVEMEDDDDKQEQEEDDMMD
jgi:hypothetical protein